MGSHDGKTTESEKYPVTTKISGGCQCGKHRYSLSEPLKYSHVCHCRMCQRAVGNLFAALVGNPKAAIVWQGEAPARFASSTVASRYFCATCGTPLGFAYDDSADFYVTTGSLDDPGAAPIVIQFGTESRIHWVDFCEDVPGQETSQDPQSKVDLSAMTNFQYEPASD
jgi:hypothetical protein